VTGMKKRDWYRGIAALHVCNIDQGFLVTLGTDFLALMYQAIDEASDSVLLVSVRDGQVAGFVSGGTGMRSIYAQMIRHPFRLSAALAPSLVRPRRVLRILEILRYGSSRGVRSDWPAAELLSIAVDPAYRGRHVAEELYRQLVTHFRTNGVTAFKITVGSALTPAHRFYLKMGAVPCGEIEVHEGESSILYRHNIA